MKKIVVANWKMNPTKTHEAIELYRSYFSHANALITTIICPPYPFLSDIAMIADTPKEIALGAQDVFWEPVTGAYTGEVSVAMLKDLNVSYVIVGHSERRAQVGETDEMIAKKLQVVVEGSVVPILCVGESSEVRSRGLEAAQLFIATQLEKDIPKEISPTASLIIAYEPLWAIGTGTPDSPESASQMIDFIKDYIQKKYGVSVPVLYGGSVNSQNAAAFAAISTIDGVLVGSASWKGEFPDIMKAYSHS